MWNADTGVVTDYGWSLLIGQPMGEEGWQATTQDGEVLGPFAHQGQAVDAAEDWCLGHRRYDVTVAPTRDGAYLLEVASDGVVLRSKSGRDPHALRIEGEQFVGACRRHDLAIIELRAAARADYRLRLRELAVTAELAEQAIADAKAALKRVAVDRERLARELHAPQLDFDFEPAIPLARPTVVAGPPTLRQDGARL